MKEVNSEIFSSGTNSALTWIPSAISSLIVFFFLLRILEDIEANRKGIEMELKEILKLFHWERTEICLSVENSKRTRQKLRKLILKYTVSDIKVTIQMAISLHACGSFWENLAITRSFLVKHIKNTSVMVKNFKTCLYCF